MLPAIRRVVLVLLVSIAFVAQGLPAPRETDALSGTSTPSAVGNVISLIPKSLAAATHLASSIALPADRSFRVRVEGAFQDKLIVDDSFLSTSLDGDRLLRARAEVFRVRAQSPKLLRTIDVRVRLAGGGNTGTIQTIDNGHVTTRTVFFLGLRGECEQTENSCQLSAFAWGAAESLGCVAMDWNPAGPICHAYVATAMAAALALCNKYYVICVRDNGGYAFYSSGNCHYLSSNGGSVHCRFLVEAFLYYPLTSATGSLTYKPSESTYGLDMSWQEDPEGSNSLQTHYLVYGERWIPYDDPNFDEALCNDRVLKIHIDFHASSRPQADFGGGQTLPNKASQDPVCRPNPG